MDKPAWRSRGWPDYYKENGGRGILDEGEEGSRGPWWCGWQGCLDGETLYRLYWDELTAARAPMEGFKYTGCAEELRLRWRLGQIRGAEGAKAINLMAGGRSARDRGGVKKASSVAGRLAGG